MNSELLQKHIEFEMNLVSSENLKNTLSQEVEFFFNYVKDKKLKEIFPPDKIEDISLTYLKKLELSPEIINLIQQGLLENISFFAHEKKNISTYLDKESFFKLFEKLLEFQVIRDHVIHFLVHSKAYSRMISSIIYSAIKDFLITENPLAKNPLGGSFLKLGQDLLNNLPGMGGNFDKKITEFISQNLSGRIQQSETHIKTELSSEKTKEILEELWNFLDTTNLSKLQEAVPTENIHSILLLYPKFWEHLKTTGFIEKYVSKNIKAFYEKYSEHSMGDFMKELSIDQTKLITEITEYSYKYLNTEEFRNYYRQVLTRRLGAFYASF